ncbi:MAG: chitinase [Lachnospiraceae bacterium]|nr:chitinase [Lachnospiraceae bacterium]
MKRDDFDMNTMAPNDPYNRKPKKKKRTRPVEDIYEPVNKQYRSGTKNSTMKRRKITKAEKKKEVLHAILPPIIAIVLIIIVVVAAIFSGALDSLKYSSEKADLYSYYGISDDMRAIVVRDGAITDETYPVFDGKPYISLDLVNEEFHDRFYYDTETNSYLYTRADNIDRASADSTSITYKGSDMAVDYNPYVIKGEDVYMALDYLKLYKNFSYEIYGGDGEPYRMTYKEEWGSNPMTDIVKKQSVRLEQDKKSPILKELNEGDSVIMLEKGEEWSKVQTDDLRIGYIENKFLGNSHEEAEEAVSDVVDEVIPSNSLGEPVILAWHNVVGTSGADDIASILSRAGGVNVISPTWFTITDDEGNIDSIGSKAYVDTCHAAGVQVWGLFDNLQHLEVSSFEVFSKAGKRAKVISQLIGYAHEYGLDGINIDIETIPTESGVHFAQFIRELSIECRRDGIILSVDNYVPMGFNDHYNRYEQGVYADYVIIMGYDEHYAGGEWAGSVASIGYVRSGIENTVSQVPSGKVINAVPLYTRLWIETPKTEEEIENEKIGFNEDGSEYEVAEEDIPPYTLEIQTLKMADGIATAKANGTVAWDEETAQNYATWDKGGKKYEIWLEDKDSLTAKLDVMKENDLAGVAAWQVNYAEDYVWDLFNSYY